MSVAATLETLIPSYIREGLEDQLVVEDDTFKDFEQSVEVWLGCKNELTKCFSRLKKGAKKEIKEGKIDDAIRKEYLEKKQKTSKAYEAVTREKTALITGLNEQATVILKTIDDLDAFATETIKRHNEDVSNLGNNLVNIRSGCIVYNIGYVTPADKLSFVPPKLHGIVWINHKDVDAVWKDFAGKFKKQIDRAEKVYIQTNGAEQTWFNAINDNLKWDKDHPDEPGTTNWLEVKNVYDFAKIPLPTVMVKEDGQIAQQLHLLWTNPKLVSEGIKERELEDMQMKERLNNHKIKQTLSNIMMKETKDNKKKVPIPIPVQEQAEPEPPGNDPELTQPEPVLEENGHSEPESTDV